MLIAMTSMLKNPSGMLSADAGRCRQKSDFLSICLLHVTLLLGALPLGAGPAQEPALAPRAQRKGPLAGLPSAPGPHIEKIRAMGDNAWLELGRPAPDPQWGQGRGRSWGHKMPYAPELQGAFLAGAGPHAFIKPDGHYDDIFFYDLNANAWICIFPGVNTRTFGEDAKSGLLQVNGDGQLVDRDGRVVPLAARSHSGQTHTYDTDSHKWIYNGCAPGGIDPDWWSATRAWYTNALPYLTGRVDRVANQPLYFNTVTGEFERPAGKKPPRGGGARGEATFYLTTRKAIWTYSSDRGMEIGNPATGEWTVTKPKGAPRGSDYGACFDSKRNRIYLSTGGPVATNAPEGYVYVYDIQADTWSNPTNREHAVPLPGSNEGVLTYDSVSDRVIAFLPGTTSVSAYSPENGDWSPPLSMPTNIFRRACWHGFYSPEVNVHFIYIAGDGSDKGTMWAYRYKKGQ
jgi:hypothetical protein